MQIKIWSATDGKCPVTLKGHTKVDVYVFVCLIMFIHFIATFLSVLDLSSHEVGRDTFV